MVSLKSIIIFLIFIALVYGSGLFFHWSWPAGGFILFDVFLHILGGAWIGLVFLYVNSRLGIVSEISRAAPAVANPLAGKRNGGIENSLAAEILTGRRNDRMTYLFVFAGLLAFVSLIGISWEFAEWGAYHAANLFFDAKEPVLKIQATWYADTLDDIFNDLLGGAAVFFLLYRNRKESAVFDEK